MSAKTIKAFRDHMVRQSKAPTNNPKVDVYRGVWWPHGEPLTGVKPLGPVKCGENKEQKK